MVGSEQLLPFKEDFPWVFLCLYHWSSPKTGLVPKTFSQQDLHFHVPFIVNEDMFVGVPIDEEVDRAEKPEGCFLKLKSDYAYILFLFLSLVICQGTFLQMNFHYGF